MNLFITGSSSGLGEAFAEYFKDEKVYGLGRTEREDSVYDYAQVDISDFDALQAKLKELFVDVKKLDLIILNAGVLGRIQDTSACDIKELQKEMDINMWSNKIILDFFIKEQIEVTQVIAISSGASVNGSLGWNGYSLSKAALNMLIKLYAAEMKSTHLTALAPGLVKTKMLDSILEGDHDTQRYTSVQSLRQSEKDGVVYSPKDVVVKIVNLLDALKSKPSGSFIDIRDVS